MKVQELRIGNLVEYNRIIVKVDSIISPKPLKDKKFSDKWCIDLFDGASTIFCTIDDINSIEITSELLEKFDILDLNCIQEKGGEIFVELKNKEVGICGYDSCTSGMIYYAKCEFIHQFQNIYFALTGKELELSS